MSKRPDAECRYVPVRNDLGRQYSPISHSVRVRYKMGDQSSVHTTRRLSSAGRYNVPVIQRVLQVGIWKQEDVDHIYSKCIGMIRWRAKDKDMQISDDEVKQVIEDWINHEETYQFKSFKILADKIFETIYYGQDQTIYAPPSGAGQVKMDPFSVDIFENQQASLTPGQIYRPLSPLVLNRPEAVPLRSTSVKSVGFKINHDPGVHYVIAPGKFIPGVGSYMERLSDESIAGQVGDLLTGNDRPGISKDARKLYTLIVAVEGYARSTHNMATAAIFFKNYEVIKKMNPDKNLFQLATKFLTFVSPGGARKTREHMATAPEVQMILAHCKSNGVEMTEEGITRYLQDLVSNIIEDAGITIE